MFVNLNLNVSCRKFRSFAILLMVYSTAIDMGGGLYIKYLSYLYGCFCLILTGFNVKRIRYFEFVLCLMGLAPIMSFFIGQLNDGAASLGVSNITPFIPAVIFLFLIDNTNIKLAINSFLHSILLMSLLTIALYAVFITIPSLIIPVSDFLNNKEMGMFGIKAVEASNLPGVYFKISLFYNFAFIIYLYNKQYFKACVVLLAIVLSFSKSSLFVVGFIVLLYIFSWIKIRNGFLVFSKFKIVFLAAITVLIIFFISLSKESLSDLYNYYYDSLVGKSDTVNVRLEHFKSLIILFKEHPLYLLFGQGVGTEFYTSGFNAYVNNIEIDHLNTIRKFGIIWFVLFTLFIFAESMSLFNKQGILRYIGVAFFVTYILVGTNPLLINPFFLMLFIVIYKLNQFNSRYDISLLSYV